jgi:hypothetical protein
MAREDHPTLQNQDVSIVGHAKFGPYEPARLDLGSYKPADVPPGFSIEYDPEPQPPKSVVANVTRFEDGGSSRSVCLVDNHGTKPVEVTIRRLADIHGIPRDAELLHGADGAAFQAA